jgi:hypothetical protein
MSRNILYLILSCSIISGLLISFILTGIISISQPRDVEGKGYNQTIDYYAYGDSITRANVTSYETFDVNFIPNTTSRYEYDLHEDGSDSYINQMVTYHDPDATAFHNMISGCKTTKCGYEGLDTIYKKRMKYFIYMFVTNDNVFLVNDMTVNDTINYTMKTYDYIAANGSVAIPCIPPLVNDIWVIPIDQQIERIHAMESAFDARGIFYVKMYDALDSIPGNGEVDGINTTYQPDGTHPNLTGQRILGDYLWEQMSKRYNLSSLT